MHDIPLELQTPENLICNFLDRGDAGEAIIKMLTSYGFAIVPTSEIDSLKEQLADMEKRVTMTPHY